MEEREVFVFTDEELHSALGNRIGADRKSVPEDRPSPDPGTVTTPETQKYYSVSRDSARKHLHELIDDGVLIRDWVWRYDPWPPYKKKKVKGFRMVGKIPGKD